VTLGVSVRGPVPDGLFVQDDVIVEEPVWVGELVVVGVPLAVVDMVLEGVFVKEEERVPVTVAVLVNDAVFEGVDV